MTCIPVHWSFSVLAVADRPPPIACRTKEKKSAVMKRYVYVLGAKRDSVVAGS
jgi:hypothetical protein